MHSEVTVPEDLLIRRAEASIASAREMLLTEPPTSEFGAQAAALVDELTRDIAFVQQRDYELALIGAPGIGKTTTLCALADLRRQASDDITNDAALLTGSGRTTLSDVLVGTGDDLRVEIEPLAPSEVQAAIEEFAFDLVREVRTHGAQGEGMDPDGSAQASELRRALRGITQLSVEPLRNERGLFMGSRDHAKELATEINDPGRLATEMIRRARLDERVQCVFRAPPDGAPMDWLSAVFSRLNNGVEPNAPLPRRLRLIVPRPVLAGAPVELAALSLVDSRGIDDPAAPRRDIHGFLDGERSVLVLCSGFADAPDAVAQSVIHQAYRIGRADALRRTVLLVLVRGDEDARVVAPWGEVVQSGAEGRAVREEQIREALRPQRLENVRVLFLNVARAEEVGGARSELIASVTAVRNSAIARIAATSEELEQLISARHNQLFRELMTEALRPIRRILQQSSELPSCDGTPQGELVSAIKKVRYAAALRASVNREGEWHNFDYWLTLAAAARALTKVRAQPILEKLASYIDDELSDPHFAPVHGMLRTVRDRANTKLTEMLMACEAVAEAAYRNELPLAPDYWQRAKDRWGKGQGYKEDIARWTAEWLAAAELEPYYDTLEEQTQAAWRNLLSAIEASIGTSAAGSESSQA